jgi:cyanophycinase
MPGLLVLNGGDEFRPGNEPQDRWLVAGARRGPAYVVPTAAARQRPDLAVATAQDWFRGLGLEVEELPVYSRRDAASPELAGRAAAAGLLYLTGGDPGLVARVLAGSRAWDAMLDAWEAGAALAGSSAGAMALCQWTLVMRRWPRHSERRAAPGLSLVPGTALVPHHERFGPRWQLEGLPPGATVLGVDERTGLSWEGGRWCALGAGAVTVLADGARRRYAGGEECRGVPPPELSQARGEAAHPRP